MMDMIRSFETAVLLFIQENIRCRLLDPIMIAASWIGDKGVIWILTAIVLLCIKQTRRGGLYQGVSLAVAHIICNYVIKKLVLRPRPYLDISTLQILVSPETSTSFPSAHTASSFACAYALTYIFGRKGAWAYLPASLIALSRLYVGVHYPTDVLFGIALGTLIAMVICKLLDRIFKKSPKA